MIGGLIVTNMIIFFTFRLGFLLNVPSLLMCGSDAGIMV
jgi:hypothetical protein